MPRRGCKSVPIIGITPADQAATAQALQHYPITLKQCDRIVL
jgi:hypothetical protein